MMGRQGRPAGSAGPLTTQGLSESLHRKSRQLCAISGCRSQESGVNGLRICRSWLQRSEAILLLEHNGVQGLNELSWPTRLLYEMRAKKLIWQLLN